MKEWRTVRTGSGESDQTGGEGGGEGENQD